MTEPTTDTPELALDPERRVVEAAKLYIAARQSFNRMRTSGRHNSREIDRARMRRDQATNLLESAVEELPA